MGIGLEIAFILLLILANGLFAMSEIAVVSSRRARLQQRSKKGDRGAAVALAIADSPNQFLSTVQIGITLIGTLAGAYGGATLAKELAGPLSALPGIGAHADAFAFAVTVAGITYFSLILGELVPKRIGLNAPETIASIAAPPMKLLSRAASPIVRFLSFSTELVLKLLPFHPPAEPAITEDEVRTMIELGADSGVFHREEREMLEGVFRLGDRRSVDLMTPRSKIVWIDLDRPVAETIALVRANPFSIFPAAHGSLDRFAGFLESRDFIAADASGTLSLLPRKPIFVPETFPAFRLVERFRTARIPLAMVVDEHGQVVGMLTPTDLLESIVGDLPLPQEEFLPKFVRHEDGSLSVDGLMTIDELKEVLGIEESIEAERTVTTLGGFVLHEMKRIPEAGDAFDYRGFRFEVLEMDGHRVDRVLVTRIPEA